MAGKDIHSEVEGHMLRVRGHNEEPPETTEIVDATDEPEVEGQAIRGKAPVAEVEGHATVRVKRNDAAEPETTEVAGATDEPEVEGQLVRVKGAPVAEVEGHGLVRGK
jgi:hypothetical protein